MERAASQVRRYLTGPCYLSLVNLLRGTSLGTSLREDAIRRAFKWDEIGKSAPTGCTKIPGDVPMENVERFVEPSFAPFKA